MKIWVNIMNKICNIMIILFPLRKEQNVSLIGLFYFYPMAYLVEGVMSSCVFVHPSVCLSIILGCGPKNIQRYT